MSKQTFRRPDPFRAALSFTFAHWARQRGAVSLVAALVVIQTMADVFVPLFAGKLVDAVALGLTDRDAATRAALWALGAMLALGVGALVFRHLTFVGVTQVTLKTMTEVAQEGFARVQRFSTDWHANNFAGSTVRKVTRGMWALDLLTDTLLIALLPSIVVLVGTTILLGWNWPILGAIVFAGAVVYVGMTVVVSLKYVSPSARLANSWDTRVGGALADAVSCNAVVKSFGAEAREDARLSHVLSKWRTRTRRTWLRGTNAGTAQNAVLLVLRAAILGGVLVMWMRGQASAGDVAFVLTSYTVVQGYLRDVGMHVHNLQRSVNDMEELVALSAATLGVADRSDAKPIKVTRGEVAFENVTFHYGGHAEPLYRDFSVTLRAGEKVGLVGRSGSGKTTFVKLIQRLYDVNAGRIAIDGQEIAAATQASLRGQIAIVQQEPLLFHRSLAENIAYGRPGASQSDIERAARLANAHDFITRLPSGYSTLVGERGVKLSGGERQRVALARAFLADAPILILDEATSSLDSESEALVQEAMERLMANRTTIVIAHRLSTVRAMDRILVFDRGTIAEEGDHASLVRLDGGIYRALFERQALELTKGLAA
ncbi:putative multidrug export ATP-binding/permease protein [Variibacter gotjawalensis]|uniref:Putative multidrug export ATP-binding/permease protein n=1 Tax=Variibacter gotjawalensis TaxID=1333996 RepID=A0A0S3PZQ0_9BRAD|nr:ABC transporter ATP-binding protein [Variibacter gotjawalensis]NIK47238.1 ATP-binding cassette subfamily B protein [Variibacter gotjawalensis]RZS49139.1 ATP-binding cassette subfamily B protein [Variibacter gotjawalensis]BAT61400.1 putative multidrug export ATP-binding/permease protein [Variibacter gotjawalensis]